jgi:hypothetical protein
MNIKQVLQLEDLLASHSFWEATILCLLRETLFCGDVFIETLHCEMA